MTISLYQSVLFCVTFSLFLKMPLAADMKKCMKHDDYKGHLEVVRVQSSTYQNMKSDGSVDKRYYEDTYVLLNVGREALCSVDFMLVLPTTDKTEFRSKLSGLPPGASPRETIDNLVPPSPSKGNDQPSMEIYAMEGMKVEIETNPNALYPKVTGRGRGHNNRQLAEKDSNDGLNKQEDSSIITGSLPDLYLAPNDADMFGFTLYSIDKDAPTILPELCVVSYQVCNTETMTEGQNEQMEDMAKLDESLTTSMEEMKRSSIHPRKKISAETGEIDGFPIPGGLHPVRRQLDERVSSNGPSDPIRVGNRDETMMAQYKYKKRPKWHSGWMSQEQIKLGVHPIPVNHGGKKKMKPLYNQRYPINSKLNDPHTVRIGGMDVVDWRPSKASRFDIVIVERPENRETEDYLALPREEDEKNSEAEDYIPLSREKFDVAIVDRPEDKQTEDYLALPREEDEEDEVEENSETEDYEFVPRNDHGPGGDHAVRRTRYLRR
jgi:hypothetical protein